MRPLKNNAVRSRTRGPPGTQHGSGGRRPRPTGDMMVRMINLVRRLTARLGRRGHDSSTGLGLPCMVCGQPATGWATSSNDANGTQVIDGYAACAAHQAAKGLPRTKAG